LVLTVADGPTGRNLYQALKAAAFGSNLAAPYRDPKSTVILVASLEDGIGGDAFKSEMETYGRMEPDKVIEDLKRRAKLGKVTEASQKPNRLALDDKQADFIVVSPKAPGDVGDLLDKTRIKFFRTIDDALGSLDKSLYQRDVAVIPHGSSTVPLSSR
jgi:hypothetical protein